MEGSMICRTLSLTALAAVLAAQAAFAETGKPESPFQKEVCDFSDL
jgi:hypothetical protein